MRIAPLLLVGALGPGCTSGSATTATQGESESENESEGESGSGFDPAVCGAWEPDPVGPPGELPAELACADAFNCPQFVPITSAAHIQHQQYIPVSGSRAECLFDLASGDGTLPNADCEPQWFTGGAAVADVNADGLPDVYVTRLGASDHLYVNGGDGRFAEEAQARGLGDCLFTNGAVFGDIDNDGDPDLLVTTTGDAQHMLFVNDGGGVFTEQGEAWGFALAGPGRHGGESVTLGDYDLDGRLDAHVNGWIEPHNYPDFESPGPHGSRLLHNTGGAFEDVTEAAGVSLLGANEKGIYGFSSAFVDLDDDGWPELAIAADFRSSRMFWNEGATAAPGALPGFSDGTVAARVNAESNAMGSTFGDFDGDGRLDWYVTSIGERDAECPDTCDWKSTGNRLYRNNGDRSFDQMQDFAGVRDGGWAWGTTMFDMDNDGDLDLYAVNGWPGRDLNAGLSHRASPARLWRNRGNGEMDEVAVPLGADDEGQGRAVIAFDYDADGDLDLFIANHAQAPTLLRNDGGNTNAWLDIEVEGSESNRDGRGAVIEVQIELDGPVQRRQVGAGSHFLGEGPLVQHFGLGADVSSVHRVSVQWPASGRSQELNDVAAAQRLHVLESD